MLKNKNTLFVIMLLNASLIIGPVQMTFASVMPSKEKNSQNHDLNNKNSRRCKHSGSAMHSSKTQAHTDGTSHSSVHKMEMSEHKGMKMANEGMEEHACECPSLCAECCGGHATVALLEFEFYQLVKPDSAQPDTKLIYYTPVFLPIEIPPPLA